MDAGDHEGAIPLYRECLRRFPSDADLWFSLGIALRRACRPLEAEQALDECVRLSPDAEVHYALGNVQRDLGDLHAALCQYHASLYFDPTHGGSICNLGLTLFNLDRCEEAEQVLRTGIALHPQCDDTYRNLGGVLWQLGRDDEAIEAYRAAVRCNPEFVEVWTYLASLLRDHNRFEEAAEAEKVLAELDAPDEGTSPFEP
jgi:tetratricopeptide (TPR) repeat protein